MMKKEAAPISCRSMDCGDLHNGFTRMKCKNCRHESTFWSSPARAAIEAQKTGDHFQAQVYKNAHKEN